MTTPVTTPPRPINGTRPAATPAPAPVAAPRRMTLGAVVKGKLEKPDRTVVYGTAGVGKSTFAAMAPEPIFLCAEDGTAQLDVARFPEPRSWPEVFEAIETLIRDAHTFKTLVIDTLDWMEPLCWAHICHKAGKKSIEDFGYGKGYVAAQDEWRSLLAALDRLRHARGMAIVILAHSQVKSFKNPEGEDYDRYLLKCNDKLAGTVSEWADNVLFARLETYAVNKDGKVRGVTSGARIVHTTRTAAYEAKNRRNLPDTMPLSWPDFEAACKAEAPASVERLTADISEAVAEAGDEAFAAKVAAGVEKAAGDAAKLAQLRDWARAKSAQIQSNKVNATTETKE